MNHPDILAWLHRAITRVETVARATTERQPYDEWDAAGDDRTGDTARKHWSVVGIAKMDPTPAARDLATHIALHDPASVLRRCAADRKVLALHNTPGQVFPDGAYMDDNRWCVGCGFDSLEEPMVADVNDCPTLNALAEGYGWRTLTEIRAELDADGEGCEACATYGECLDHDSQHLDDQAERIFRDQGSGRDQEAP